MEEQGGYAGLTLPQKPLPQKNTDQPMAATEIILASQMQKMWLRQ
jgi:hypothetical protein